MKEVDPIKKTTADSCLNFVKSTVWLYDAVSTPLFYPNHRRRLARAKSKRAVCRQLNPDDPASPWQQVNLDNTYELVKSYVNSFETYDKLLDASFITNADDPCYGYRELLNEITEDVSISSLDDDNNKKRQQQQVSNSKKVVPRQQLSDYRWVTYAQFAEQIEAAKCAFLLQGVRSGDVVIVFAETRPEWQVAAQALIRIGAVVGTMYATLNDDGIQACLEETRATMIVTHVEYIERLLGGNKQKLGSVKKIIYFERSMRGVVIPITTTTTKQSDSIDNTHNQNGKQSNGIISVKFVSNNNDNDVSEAKATEKVVTKLDGNIDNNNIDDDGDFGVRSTNDILQRVVRAYDERIVMDDETKQEQTTTDDRIVLVSFTHMLATGRATDPSQLGAYRAPTNKDALVVIMYTSGSTGRPKGVCITHANIMSVMESFSYVMRDFVNDAKMNMFASYLPLAHIFEFSIQSMMILHGVKFGYASPYRLTDTSPGLMHGVRGDFTLLKPTFLVIVPLILERIASGIRQAVAKEPSYFKRRLVEYLIRYKIKWSRRQYATPLVDRLVCRKVGAAALGGRCRYMICGAAPLNADTHEFICAVLGVECPQGFGATETCAAATCQLFGQLPGEPPNVGYPVAGSFIKLENWPEGKYSPHDRPHPRGEILVGGGMVAQGYFGHELDEQTREAFYKDEHGVTWYRTGDIGMFLPDGALRIIDRKKDFVKLQNGEFITMGKIESALKTNDCFDNFCVHVNTATNSLVALSSVNPIGMLKLARELANNLRSRQMELDSDEAQLIRIVAETEENLSENNLRLLCDNRLIDNSIQQTIVSTATAAKLSRVEVPKRVVLVADEWTPESGLVTSAMKIRRHFIYDKYADLLKAAHTSG